MSDRDATERSTRRRRQPLDRRRIEDLALSYVARFATSAAKLEAYLHRKLRERGWDEDEGEADVAGLIERFVARGWVDDEGWGRMRTGSLLARGYGARRIDQALREGGIDEALRSTLLPGEEEQREAAAAHARRRRLGPFGPPFPPGPAERARLRQKQLAAMVRAGHDFAAAARIIDAVSEEEVTQWVREAVSFDRD